MENRKKISYLKILILLFFLFPVFVSAASLSVSPTSGTFEVGDKVTLRISVSTDLPINAISGVVSFPPIFLVESVSKSPSIINFWVTEPNFSNGAGTLQFEGVALNGFESGVGSVVTVVLKANKEGSGNISFKSGQILANDGQGTDLTSGLLGGSYSIKAKTVKPLEIPKDTPKTVVKEEEKEIPIIEDEPQSKPTLASPEIMIINKFGQKAVYGKSDYFGSQVLLTFISSGGTKIFITGETDDRGEFVLFVPQTLKRDLYTISAIIIQKDTEHSFNSNEISVKIGGIFSDISPEIKISIIILILVLLYLIVRTYFHLKKNKKLRVFVKKESKEAEDILHKSFDIIKNDLEGSMSNRTKSEILGQIKEIKKDLTDAEDIISKEIKDIEKL